MSRHSVYSLLTATVVILVAVCAPQTALGNDDIYREGTAAGQMFHKLGRGVTNTFTGILEIPKNIAREWKRAGEPFTGAVVGTSKGIAWGFCRTVSGIYDVVTFPFAVPEDYRPLMEPEFVLPGMWGAPIPEMEPVSGLKPLHP
jgi:putative exosortase-associated protein (TIGR04073 family)